MKLRMTAILTLILSVAMARLALSGVPNVSPIAAIALFSGTYLVDRKVALLLPLAALLIGDLLLGFHVTMVFVYASFALTVVIGFWLSRHVCGQVVIAASLVTSALFFIITNFGVWLLEGIYPMTLAGLIACYVAAIPYFQMTLFGDLFFVAVIFGLFMAIDQYLPVLSRPGDISSLK